MPSGTTKAGLSGLIGEMFIGVEDIFELILLILLLIIAIIYIALLLPLIYLVASILTLGGNMADET
ncbi:MAG: hypothetical protein Q6363_008290 [Candidatus Njordarchaeota archaeon]